MPLCVPGLGVESKSDTETSLDMIVLVPPLPLPLSSMLLQLQFGIVMEIALVIARLLSSKYNKDKEEYYEIIYDDIKFGH